MLIRSHRLTEKLDFFAARLDQGARLAQHFVGRGGALAPAGVRHHAKGTEAITAALDGDVANDSASSVAGRVQALVGFLRVEGGVVDLGAGARFVDMSHKAAIAVRPHDQVNKRRPGAHLTAQMLCHAAGYSQHHMRSLGLVGGQRAGASPHPFHGLFAYGAGVDQDHIGHGRIIGPLVSRPLQQAEHNLAVGHVHLAAVGLDIGQEAHIKDLLIAPKPGPLPADHDQARGALLPKCNGRTKTPAVSEGLSTSNGSQTRQRSR